MRSSHLSIPKIFMSGLAMLGLVSCGSLGDTTGSLLVSDQDEYAIGQQFDVNLRADPTNYPLYDLSARLHQKVRYQAIKAVAH